MYTHLTKETRIKLSALLLAGLSLRAAARLLGYSHSTLSRELRRNRPVAARQQRYHPGDAQRQTAARRLTANARCNKITTNSILEHILVEKLACFKWAPAQIAGWLRMYRPCLYVCAQTIYHWIHSKRNDLRLYLHCLKRTLRRTRQAKDRKAIRAAYGARRHISTRPAHVGSRKTYGHWEGDTVHGTGKSGYIATFVERKSGYLLAAVLTPSQYSSRGFADAASVCFAKIPARYRKTLTLDNGPEMKLPERIEQATGAAVYYATPYHSWERGTNENTNGLLRYFFPKKSSFATLTQKELDVAVQLLNTRPRKRLNWRTPEQMIKW